MQGCHMRITTSKEDDISLDLGKIKDVQFHFSSAKSFQNLCLNQIFAQSSDKKKPKNQTHEFSEKKES